MRFKDKYTNVKDLIDPDRIIISPEAYAICELIEKILDKLEHIRLGANK